MKKLRWKRWAGRKVSGADRKPWIFYLPKPFQISSGLIFMALMLTIVGLAALTGLSDPTTITREMTLPFYNMWGAALAIGGLALTTGIVIRDQLIEKYAARIVSIQLFVYAAWAIVAVGLTRAIATLFLAAIAVFFLEQRICFINVLLDPQRMVGNKVRRTEEDD